MEKEVDIKQMMYFFWCNEFEYNPKLCDTHARYREYLKKGKVHCGDCTGLSFKCVRCHIQELEKKAQNAIDCLKSDIGYCGRSCWDFENCPFVPIKD